MNRNTAALCAGLAFATLGSRTASAQTIIYTDHTDLNIHYTPAAGTDRSLDTWALYPRDDDAGGIEYGPGTGNGDAILNVSTDALTSLPASGYGFTGASPGDQVWLLPQSQDPNLLYLGVSGYGVTPSQVDKYDPSVESGGRVSGNGPWVKLSLDSVAGPTGGQFSVFQNGLSGPNVFMATSDGIGHTPGVGDDSLWIVANGHIHYNWVFTKPGDYFVSFTSSLFYNADGNQNTLDPISVSSPQTVHFRVEGQPVPEPASLITFGLGGLAILRRRKHRGNA